MGNNDRKIKEKRRDDQDIIEQTPENDTECKKKGDHDSNYFNITNVSDSIKHV